MPTSAGLYNENQPLRLAKFSDLTESNARQLLENLCAGTYHHWGRGYLQQYLNELDFHYNNRKVNDSERTMLALRATEGKRLTLREPNRASA